MTNEREHKGITDIVPKYHFVILILKGILVLIINFFLSLFKHPKLHRQICTNFFGFRKYYKDIYYTSSQPLNIDSKSLIISNHIVNFDMLYLFEFLENITDNKQLFYLIGAPKSYIVKKVFRDTNIITFEKPDSNPVNLQILNKISTQPHHTIIYPEGQIISSNNYQRGLDICKKYDLQPFKNLLPPAPKGTFNLLKNGNYKYILDVTVAYDGYTGGYDMNPNEDFKIPTFQATMKHNREGGIYLHINKIDISTLHNELKDDNNELDFKKFTNYLTGLWREKDELLNNFVKNQKFTEQDDFNRIKFNSDNPRIFSITTDVI